jgi:FAD/FMN-containing dehydrogenase
VSAVYGANYSRLKAIKEKYDPANIFHLNQNIRASSAR